MTTPPDPFSDNARSSHSDSEPGRLVGCELFESMAAELALGSLSGAERSRALAHLEGCDECRRAMDELSAAADALLLAAPEADPPAGFEVRWLGRIRQDSATAVAEPEVPSGAGARAARRWTRARVLAAAAAASAVVLAGAGVGVGVAVTPRTTVGATGPIRMATLRSVGYESSGAAVGEVAIATGNPSWVVMTVQKTDWSGRVECVVTVNGRSEAVGSFWLQGGAGSWALQLPSSGASVTAASVRAVGGPVLASAVFSS